MRVRSCRRSYRTGGRTEHDNHPTYHGEWHDMNGGCACGGAGESPPPFPLGELNPSFGVSPKVVLSYYRGKFVLTKFGIRVIMTPKEG